MAMLNKGGTHIPVGKGSRLIWDAAGSTQHSILGASLVFKSKSTLNYCIEMNHKMFQGLEEGL